MGNWLWFISSYAPLWAMLALRFDPWWLRSSLGALALLGFAVVAIKLRPRGGRPSDAQLTVVGDAGSEVSGYLAPTCCPSSPSQTRTRVTLPPTRCSSSSPG